MVQLCLKYFSVLSSLKHLSERMASDVSIKFLTLLQAMVSNVLSLYISVMSNVLHQMISYILLLKASVVFNNDMTISNVKVTE